MAIYRDDEDLTFLQYCDNDDLAMLVSILTYDPKDKSPRYSESLTKHEDYQKYYHKNEHQKYWQAIAAEMQTYGANSLVTLARGGKGVCYREILIDVCKRQKVNFSKKAPIEMLEMALMMKMLEVALEKMSDEEKMEFVAEMGMNISVPSTQLILTSLQSAIRLSGFAAYRFATTTLAYLLRLIGLKAPMSVYILLTTSMRMMSGPVGLVLNAAWFASDIASPAFRVTIPACVIIGYLRQRHLYETEQSKLSQNT
ncbi:DUF3944 domain-containing protein [Orbus wheelerorum]|uniref:DUF3944 domain-containing protein n=1 Tax=Orbus wheelerorum TaxID=3074111 RepID=UPI00370D6C7E